MWLSQLNQVFSNRELAIGFWILIFILYALSLHNVRAQIPGMLKIMFSRKLVYWYITMCIYYLLMIYILIKIGFWEYRQLKDTLVWFFVTGVISASSAIGKAKDISYFYNMIKENVKIVAIVEFITNLYSFRVIWEIVIVFLIIVSSIFVGFIEHSADYQNRNAIIKNFFNAILFIIGFIVIIHSIRSIILGLDQINVSELIKDFLLPLLLSLMFVIYIYFFVLYAAYEIFFIRLSFKKTIDDNLRGKLKLRILFFCNINIKKVSNFVQNSQVLTSYVTRKSDIKKLFDNYRRNTSREISREGSNIS
ncbi:hypothetical protein POTG_02320 [Paenibacillus sp. oral taxon 786 str. D14]|uniref:hypothetical protein n=1 Tax=Paenibacillus sp. oral taxon 786 TaxID=652715 RepID=UPI0001AFDB97|nr:hypothetical protein [Paenibacillus sp. oral taxon 786]EES72913.1 hypothetical protein POTG_02320 [Paenibacillus sp. oral taxon 786 str. D14]